MVTSTWWNKLKLFSGDIYNGGDLQRKKKFVRLKYY